MKLSNEEFQSAAKHDPLRAGMMALAQLEEKELEKKIAAQVHKPAKHEEGFHLSLETPEGVIGLWSCWLGDQLYIGYPKEWSVSDELIQTTLELHDASAVFQSENLSKKEFSSNRKYGDFYGDRLENGGRVWVKHEQKHTHGHHFPIIQKGKLKELYYGHDESKSIATYPYSHFNENELDGPSTAKEAIMSFRNKFIQLVINIANEHGGINAIHTKYEFTILVPELLETMGYEYIHYVKGSPECVEGFGGTIVHATRGKEELMLKSANSLVPWVNIRKILVDDEVTVEDILNKHLIF